MNVVVGIIMFFFLAYDNFQRRAALKLGGSSSLYRSDAYCSFPDSLLDVGSAVPSSFRKLFPYVILPTFRKLSPTE